MMKRAWVGSLAPFLLAIATVVSPVLATFDGFIPTNPASTFPEESNGRLTDTPSVQAYKLAAGERIDLDGRLDEPCWRNAPTGSGFGMWDPDRGAESTEDTFFKVVFSDDAIYFGVACHEEDPSQIRAALSRRDEFNDSDFVSIYIDPYHDRSTGYNFRVNPLGVQQDRYVYNDGDTDRDWDAVWKVETWEDADGWYAEFEIPFSSIRYSSNIGSWGIQVRRFMHGRGEDDSWSVWDRDTPGFVSRFGTVTGLNNLPTPRQLEVLPYVVYRQTDQAMIGPEENDHFSNFGLDLKYGLSSAYTLNATIQPDFGQVEADPAVLNLGPFETFFSEKRPFFVEGSRYFQHQDFNLFYSRRIGGGGANARIRYAGKLTGKSPGGTSIGVLAAATDVTGLDQNHNFLKDGEDMTRYFVARVGQEVAGGKHRFNVTGTAVDYANTRRQAYTGGADFRMQFFDRSWRLEGSVVGSAITPDGTSDAPNPRRVDGTGGEFSISRRGKTSLGAWARWESDLLQLNDMGFLGSPDEMGNGAWGSFQIEPTDDQSFFNNSNLNLNYWRHWLYAGRTGYDLHTGEEVWSYDRGHPTFWGGNANGWTQFSNYWEGWWGLSFQAEGTQRYHTRSTVTLEDGGRAAIPGGGPLISEPRTYGSWFGFNTDTRKPLVLTFYGDYWWDVARNYSASGGVELGWTLSSAMRFEIEPSFSKRVDDTQHLDNFENPGAGIGGVSYVFGAIDQETVDVTLRANLLFSRNSSFELYAQPFVTVGNYTNARELLTPDTYDLVPYTRNGFRAEDRDFRFSAVNLNAVYRWEYRPGSTIYLVWSHARSDYGERRFTDDSLGFENGLNSNALFRTEPENIVLLKVSYWLPI